MAAHVDASVRFGVNPPIEHPALGLDCHRGCCINAPWRWCDETESTPAASASFRAEDRAGVARLQL